MFGKDCKDCNKHFDKDKMAGIFKRSEGVVKKHKIKPQVLPVIPKKRFFKTGEVAKLCKVEPHVIRYWGKLFSKFVKPIVKSKMEMKYYRYEDVKILRKIRKLLYADGFTIRGAIMQLTES